MKLKSLAVVLLGFLLAASLSGKPRSSDFRWSKLGRSQKGRLERLGNMKVMRFDNGVQALIQENHSAPVVALQVWVKAGSGDETDPLAGVAHMIEHMMFKGSEKFPAGELAHQIEAKGGILNAYTSSDFTVYWTVLSSRFYQTGLELFSDAIFKPKFDSEELEREREVVLEEIRRQEDNPRARLYNQLMKLTYQAYPYRRPVIGYQDTVSGFERKQLMRFFNCSYRPDNMLVVLVGDITPEQAEENLKKYFGQPLARESCELPDQRQTVEPEQNEMTVRLTKGQLNRGYIYLAYKTSSFGDADMAALDLLASILGQGESSRLVERVRNQKKLVDEIFAYSNTPRGPGAIIIAASLDPKNLIPASQEIIATVNSIKDRGVEDWELARAKRQIESDAIYSRETMEGNARRIGFFSSIIGDPGYEKKYLDQVSKVSAAEIQKTAQKYLPVSRLALAGMMPEAALKKDTASSLKAALLDSAQKSADWVPGQEKLQVRSAGLWPLPSPALGEKMASEPKKFALKNGIRLLVRENHYVPLVSVRAGFAGGVRFENDSDNGVFNLIAEMLTEGAKDMSAAQIHRSIESLAANINGFAGRNSFGLTMTAPSPNFDQSLELFAKLLSEPTFPSKDLERMRAFVLAALQREQDQPRIMVNNLFYRTLFNKHPYRLNPLGSEESLKKLKRNDLVDIYRQFAAADSLVIAVSGDVRAEKVKARLEALFADFNQAGTAISAPPAEPDFSKPRIKEIDREGSQAQIVYGWLGTTLSSSDEPAVEVLSEILSGMSGRLFVELRDKRSLAYEVSAYHTEGVEPGYIAGYIGCAAEKKQGALSGMLEEFEKLKTGAGSEEEIARAKNSLIGSYEIELQNNLTIATHMFFDELYDLGFGHWQKYPERIDKVGWKEIEAAANKYLSSGYALAIINPKPPGQKKKSR